MSGTGNSWFWEPSRNGVHWLYWRGRPDTQGAEPLGTADASDQPTFPQGPNHPSYLQSMLCSVTNRASYHSFAGWVVDVYRTMLTANPHSTTHLVSSASSLSEATTAEMTPVRRNRQSGLWPEWTSNWMMMNPYQTSFRQGQITPQHHSDYYYYYYYYYQQRRRRRHNHHQHHHHHYQSSLSAVRSLLSIMEHQHNPIRSSFWDDQDEESHSRADSTKGRAFMMQEDETLSEDDIGWSARRQNEEVQSNQQPFTGDYISELVAPQAHASIVHSSQPPPPPPPPSHHHHTSPISRRGTPSQRNNVYSVAATISPSEAASQLAEGTLRALRDLALDEAVELNEALRYWNERWERPLLSWLEAGPTIWFRKEEGGYQHQEVGQKISQLQAVLVRRCAAIGELQQHLLRAGWRRGVAQWGFLGTGTQWAAVAGFDGNFAKETINDEPTCYSGSNERYYAGAHSRVVTHGEGYAGSDANLPEAVYPTTDDPDSHEDSRPTLTESERGKSRGKSPYKANVVVSKKPGGGIVVDDPSRLAEWSVEAMSLIRRYIYRAGNGTVNLPHQEHWVNESLPLWAERFRSHQASSESQDQLAISNLYMLITEVEDLLDALEDAMDMQRQRRLEKLRPPSWIRRSWYIIATTVPLLSALSFWIVRRGEGRLLLRSLLNSFRVFFKEHLHDPLMAIFKELMKGRESFSDKKSRREAIESLKNMIRAWLDDNFPDMPMEERLQRSEAMDMSLIEKMKEESMKTVFKTTNLLQISFIEMQYMKKEMMNALHAMDEMMSANDMNMNVAAITPAVIFAYIGSRIFRFIAYALLKVGRSREEIHASFRRTITDIERLLVMRDNPPLPPLSENEQDPETNLHSANSEIMKLNPDDLGMLMLLVHECRTLMRQNPRRFSKNTIASILEDLSELTGERGAVSIRQQLQIINRMFRTYSFLKVIGTGHVLSGLHNFRADQA